MPRLKKSLGQHFLHDHSIAQRIVDLLQITHEDQILEIGPGDGALTKLILAAQPQRLVLIEKDSWWASQYVNLDTVEIKNEDALDFSWESLIGKWKIIGNLPYNVASPLIWEIVSRTRAESFVFMVQKEVAERIEAHTGKKSYGALSVWVQSYARVEWGFVVLPMAFTPPPKVDSAVIRLYPLPIEDRPNYPEALAVTLHLTFQHRRKQMQALLRQAGIAKASTYLQELNISPESRPENLSPKIFQKLSLEIGKDLLDFHCKILENE